MESNTKNIEAKWQKYWDDNKTFEAKTIIPANNIEDITK